MTVRNLAASTFVAVICLVVVGINYRIQSLEAAVERLEGTPTTTHISLDVTHNALDACLVAFLRFGQGGPLKDYRCSVEGRSVVLHGPNWSQFSQFNTPGGTPPPQKLGAVALKGIP